MNKSLINIPNIRITPTKVRALVGAIFLFLTTFPLSAQLELKLLNKYSVYTNNSIIESVAPDPKACFVDGSDFIYFNLSRVQNGFSSSSLIGKIQNGQLTMLDTIDHLGWPDRLVGHYFDEEKNIYYCNQALIGATLRKMSAQGELLWESFDTTSSTYTPWYFFEAADGSPMMPARKKYSDGAYAYTLTKFSAETGSIIWESEFIEKGAPFYTPILGKEYDNFFQVFVENNNEMNLARISKEGELIDLVTKPNPKNADILNNLLMDNLGNTYLGLNSGGYQIPKLNNFLDTIWFYQKPSPFGNESGNRTISMAIDSKANIYIGGMYKLTEGTNASLLTTKLDSSGQILWESFSHDINKEENIFLENLYFNDNKLWISGLNYDNQNNYNGVILCYDSIGKMLIYKKLEALNIKSSSAAFDFHNDEILVTASSEYAPDSIFQHILHYRVDSVSATQNLPNQILVSPYPNPTADYISIKDVNIQQIDQFSITDVQGKRVNEQAVILDSGSIDLSRLANGIYFLTYFINNQQYKAKILKQ